MADDGDQHIPMKFFFPKMFRNNLITVPSCTKHNTEIQKLEERALIYILHGSNSEEAINHFKKAVITDLMREERGGFRNDLIDEFEIDSVSFKLKYPNTLSDYMKYVVAGLYYHNFNRVLKGDTRILCNKVIDEIPRFYIAKYNLINNIGSLKGESKNKMIFDYEYKINSKFIHYWCCFYEQTEFIGITKLTELL